MRVKLRVAGVLGLLLVAAIVFWQLREPRHDGKPSVRTFAPTDSSATTASAQAPAQPTVFPPHLVAAAEGSNIVKDAEADLPFRVQNTVQEPSILVRNPKAILLQNALIDTESATAIGVPKHLLSSEDPRAYIVQAAGKVSDSFRSELAKADAKIISYVPNNAYLVRVSANGAKQIAGSKLTQSVLPFEPFYKLEPALLEFAVERKPLPAGAPWLVTGYAGDADALREELARLGFRVLQETPSPFGPGLVVQPVDGSADNLIALASSSNVQGIERFPEKVLLNDLTRVRLGVSSDTIVPTNHFNLSGTNIVVNINDTGVDATHPDLLNRVLVGDFTLNTDEDGHGTHVAGIIGSSGVNSLYIGTNAPGSVEGASFRGMANGSTLLSFDYLLSDRDLQELPARTNYFHLGRTNALISNNSWGYGGSFGYNSPSASYDAAVRDAIQGATGPQPVLFVFAAGNSGNGANGGTGGRPGRVTSPATAKNVISVGSIEAPRFITNEVIRPDQFGIVRTNREFLGMTDSSNQVVFSSSRGNSGINVEGEFGRFKPDVVAPGSFVVSTRSQQWNDDAYYNPTNFDIVTITNVVIEAGETNRFSLLVPENSVGFRIRTLPNTESPDPFPPLQIYTNFVFDPAPSTVSGNFAGTNDLVLDRGDAGFTAPAIWYYDIVNTNTMAVNYDLRTAVLTTNDWGNYFQVLKGLDDRLAGNSGTNVNLYRFESGTSMAAPAVSGMLALIQERLEQQGQTVGVTNPSPALLKAMLINSARAAGPNYTTLNVNNSINLQGWGVPDIRRVLPETNSVLLFDQSPTNALATDEVETKIIGVSGDGSTAPMRVTLVWTDPPGNPNVGVKLVNDLDLVVTNLDTGDVYYGNNFGGNGEFSGINVFNDTNGPVVVNGNQDVVNNVENVYLSAPLGASYAISVVGKRVNVNAVTTQTNGIEQDFALVISSGDSSLGAPFTISNVTQTATTVASVTVITNGVPLLNQRVGANSPLLVSTNGTTNQWRFYVLENTNGFTNVAFATFLPQDLSGISTRGSTVPTVRNLEADIDLYVSTDPALTNLDVAVIAAADKSTNRGGTEFIVYSNATAVTYYVGVKSEDQRAANYSFFGIASATPFSEQDGANTIVTFVPMPSAIPDGSANDPGIVTALGFSTSTREARRVVAYAGLEHQLFGDLVGSLTHNQTSVVLNNHSFPLDKSGNTVESGAITNLYNDLDEGDLPGSMPTDGPGSLQDFVGEQSAGLWLLTMQDNAPAHIGTNLSFVLQIEPQTNDANGTVRDILANRFVYDFVNVPAGATNLVVEILDTTGTVEVYVRRTRPPTLTTYDKKAIINPPAGRMDYSVFDSPALRPGRYFIGLYNPGGSTITVRYRIRTEVDLSPASVETISMTNSVPLVDDAVTNSYIVVTNDALISDLSVGLRIDHPRVSDLSIRLRSPEGTRILLFENRGGLTTNGLGATANPTTNSVTKLISDFETNAAGFYTNGTFVDGWFVASNQVFLSDLTNSANSGNQYLALRGSKISRLLPTTSGKNYRFSYAYKRQSLTPMNWWTGNGVTTDVISGQNGSLQNGATYASGVVGNSFIFNGTGAYVDSGATAANFGTNDFTIDFWIRTTSTRHEGILAKRPACGAWSMFDIRMGGVGSGKLNLEAYSDTSNSNPLSIVTSAINDGNFHHVAFVRQGVKIWAYIDGNLNASNNSAGITMISNATSVLLGRSPCVGTDGTQPFTGQLDEVALYRQALTASEIKDIFLAGSVGKCGTSAPPTNCAPASVQLGLGGVVTNVLVPGSSWAMQTTTFVGPTNIVTAVFEGPAGVAIDNVKLIEETITGNSVYAVFTENTNLFPALLKFATPPFGTNTIGSTNASFTTNGFETPTAGIFAVGSSVEGWNVVSSNVSVVTEPLYARSGSNVLALNTVPSSNNAVVGAVSRTFATTAGRTYTVELPYRRPHSSLVNWWNANSNSLDTIGGATATLINGTSYTNGLAGFAFRFDGVDDYLTCGTNAGNFGTNDFTIEFWVKTSSTRFHEALIEKWPSCGASSFFNIRIGGPGVGTGRLGTEMMSDSALNNRISLISTTAINDGNYHHVALRRKGINLAYYIDGVLNSFTNSATGIANINNTANLRMGLSVCNITDGTQPFTGQLDEVGIHNRAISDAEIKSLFLARSVGRTDSSNPPTNSPPAFAQVILNGATNNIAPTDTWTTFTGSFTADGPSSVIQIAGITNGIWLDAINIAESGGGQYYYPEESLRLLAGENAMGTWTLEVWDNRAGAAVGGNLISWELLFTFAPTPSTVRTRPLIHGVNATNIVYTNDIVYFVVDVPVAATFATNMLTSLGAGSLDLLFNQNGLPTGSLPGDFTLLFGTLNGTNTLTTNGPAPQLRPGQRYYLGVRNTNPTQTNQFTLRVDFDNVTNAPISVTPLTNAIAISTNIASGLSLDYYQFDVSSNAVAVFFEILNATGDVDLYVRKGAPLPNPGSYDYSSTKAGTSDELIFVKNTSTPVPLTPGRWYLGVYNFANVPVNYDIRATEQPAIANITDLTNYVAVTGSAEVGVFITNYFRLVIDQTNAAAAFELYNLSGEADLLVRKGDFPNVAEYDYRSSRTGTNREAIIIRGDTTSDINGTWYVAAANLDTNNVSFNVRATLSTANLDVTNSVDGNDIVPYLIEVPLDARLASNVLTSVTGGQLDLLFNQTLLPRGSAPGDFLLLSATLAGTNVLSDVGAAPQLLPGEVYNLGVRNTNAAGTNTFTLRVNFGTNDPGTFIVGLTNAIPFTNDITAGGAFHYYYFDVSSNASAVTFDLFGMDGNVDLYVRGSLPLPDTSNYDYRSVQPGTNPDGVTVTFNTIFTPGRWYLAVRNREARDVNYKIMATEQLFNIIDLADGVPTGGRTETGTLTNFYRFTITETNSGVLFELYNLTGNGDLLARRGALPTPSAYDYISAGTNYERIIVRTNFALPDINGEWYLAVPNNEVFPIDFTIYARASTNNMLISVFPVVFTGPPVITGTGNFQFQWSTVKGETYEVQGSSDLVTWSTLATIVASSSTEIYTTPFQISASPYMFFRVVQVPPAP